MFEKVTIRLACPTSPLIANLQRIVKRAMTERGWPAPVFVGAGPAEVELALVKGIAQPGGSEPRWPGARGFPRSR